MRFNDKKGVSIGDYNQPHTAGSKETIRKSIYTYTHMHSLIYIHLLSIMRHIQKN